MTELAKCEDSKDRLVEVAETIYQNHLKPPPPTGARVVG